MILGISGKMSSGKDTVAKLVQYLTSGHSNKNAIDYITAEEYIRLDYGFYMSDWQNKKFADKLKEIVCILTGCSRQDLENLETKNKLMGPAWRIHHVMGHDGFSPFDVIFSNIESATEFSDKMINYRYDVNNFVTQEWTLRNLMQKIGTECFRDLIHPDIWANALFADYSKKDKYIVTDMRFKNELEKIKSVDNDHFLIRIDRPGVATSTHISEISLDDYEDWDFKIVNNGSIDDLLIQVKLMLDKFFTRDNN